MKYLVGLLLWCHIMAAQAQPDPFPLVANAYLVKVDGVSIWEHHPNDRLPPASLTKLMTVLLALEQGQLQEAASISTASTLETGSRIVLKAGERFRVQDLLAATMIASSNDACHALTDHLGGSEAGLCNSDESPCKRARYARYTFHQCLWTRCHPTLFQRT